MVRIDINELKSRLKATWMTGDYGLFSRYMEKGAEEFLERLDIKPGTRLLDVGCGAGQLALTARAGAKVTGCDIAEKLAAAGPSSRSCRGTGGHL